MIKTEKLSDSYACLHLVKPRFPVTLKTAGNIFEVKFSQHRSLGGTTKKLSKDEYYDTRSGEIKLFTHHDKRSDDLKSVYRSISLGRDLIRANCVIPQNCRFITLTYAENMRDPKKLYNDYKNFLKRLPSEVKPSKWISAAEPQLRGAWHLHVIFIYDTEAPFVSSAVISNAWKQGFVKVRAVDNCDDMGAYLCAYLTDLEFDDFSIDDQTKVKVINDTDGAPKRVIKGARLPLYPAGMHIFRHSKSCVFPTVEKVTASEAAQIVEGASLVYEYTKKIIDTESDFENIVNTRVYNKLRKGH